MSTALTLEFSARYTRRGDGSGASSGDVRLILDADILGIKPTHGEAQSYPLREVIDIIPGDYSLILITEGGGEIALSHLGREYENFRRELTSRRSSLLLADLLMEEPLVMGGLKGNLTHFYAGRSKTQSQSEMRLYQTALVIIPEIGTPMRVPYSDIDEIIESDYRLKIGTEYGDSFIFSQLGRDLSPFKLNLEELRHNLSLAAQRLTKELMPSADIASVSKLAILMREGRTARRRDIESSGSTLWHELEQHVAGSEAADEYAFLKTIGRAQDISIGIKRGLKKEESDYIWFLVPICSLDTRLPGNAVIMEAISPDGESRATYAFRLVSRREYPSLSTDAALQEATEKFLRDTNRALLAINFRREPIYLSRDMLLRPQYARYRYAVAAMPELRSLRWSFIGRVMHHSPEQWQSDVMNLLTFNTSTDDDNAAWIRTAR